MTQALVGQNELIEQVLKLLGYLIDYGFYAHTQSIENLVKPLLSLLDGRNDKAEQVPTETKGNEGVDQLSLII